MGLFQGVEKFRRVFADKFLDTLFPQSCIYCGGEREGGGNFLCDVCRDEIEFIRRPFCDSCGSPAEISYDYPNDNFECGLCRKNPFKFDQARSLGRYDTVLRKLIHHFKYRKQPGVIAEISPLLVSYFQDSEKKYPGYCVVAVPLHFQKMKERTFDQSFLIAREVAKILGLPMETGLLRRVQEAGPQAKLGKTERKKNISGVFHVDRPDLAAGSNLLLVDDVFTTGSTVNEAAKLLKRCGADKVNVFTLARV